LCIVPRTIIFKLHYWRNLNRVFSILSEFNTRLAKVFFGSASRESKENFLFYHKKADQDGVIPNIMEEQGPSKEYRKNWTWLQDISKIKKQIMRQLKMS
jgi:hypothetical protein